MSLQTRFVIDESCIEEKTAMKAVLRVAAMAVGAGSLYGLWAAFANRLHGTDEMVRAGIAQGLSSALTTLIISSGIEAVFRVVPHPKLRVLAAVTIPPTLSLSVHVVAHLLNGTPEIAAAVAPSLLVAYGFAVLYVGGLLKAEQAAPDTVV